MGAVGGGGFIAKRGAKEVDSFSFVSWKKGCEEFASPSHPILSLPLTAFLCFIHLHIPLSALVAPFLFFIFPFFLSALTPPFLQLVLCRPCLFFCFPTLRLVTLFFIFLLKNWTKAMATTKTVTKYENEEERMMRGSGFPTLLLWLENLDGRTPKFFFFFLSSC